MMTNWQEKTTYNKDEHNVDKHFASNPKNSKRILGRKNKKNSFRKFLLLVIITKKENGFL